MTNAQLIPLFQSMYQGMMKGELLTSLGEKYTRFSLYNYSMTMKHLKGFQAEHGIIYVNQLNLSTAEKFRTYLVNKKKSKNTINNVMSYFKAIIKRLYDRGICKYSGAGIRCGKEVTTAVYHSLDEINRLLAMKDLPNGYARVRDIYVMNCFLGLRYSDLVKFLRSPKTFLRKEDGTLYIEMKVSKTRDVIAAPVGRVVREILEKYNYDFGPNLNYVYYNYAVKSIGRRLGLNDEIIYSRTEGGIRIDTRMLKYELMSTHTARRSFATNAYLAGLPILNIMKITGHKSERTFMLYIRCEALESARKIKDHWFFQ